MCMLQRELWAHNDNCRHDHEKMKLTNDNLTIFGLTPNSSPVYQPIRRMPFI